MSSASKNNNAESGSSNLTFLFTQIISTFGTLIWTSVSSICKFDHSLESMFIQWASCKRCQLYSILEPFYALLQKNTLWKTSQASYREKNEALVLWKYHLLNILYCRDLRFSTQPCLFHSVCQSHWITELFSDLTFPQPRDWSPIFLQHRHKFRRTTWK
jgi:hypothetical protein